MDVMEEEGNEAASLELNHNVDKTFDGPCTYGDMGINLHEGTIFGGSDGVPLTAWNDDYRSVTGYWYMASTAFTFTALDRMNLHSHFRLW